MATYKICQIGNSWQALLDHHLEGHKGQEESDGADQSVRRGRIN